MAYQPYPNQPYANQAASVPQLAGWWYRVGATIIDGIIVGVVAGIFYAATGSRAVDYAVQEVISLIYTTVLIGGPGRTVGMMAVSTRCVDAASGQPIRYGRSFLRWLIYTLLLVTVIGGILDILWPLWDARNQTLHDKVAGSVVVRI